MYLPLADDVGLAFEHAARYLVKRAEVDGDDLRPLELSHVRRLALSLFLSAACPSS